MGWYGLVIYFFVSVQLVPPQSFYLQTEKKSTIKGMDVFGMQISLDSGCSTLRSLKGHKRPAHSMTCPGFVFPEEELLHTLQS